MKTLLKIEVDERGIGRTEYNVGSQEEGRRFAVCLMALMSNSESFRKIAEAVVHIYKERTAEVRETVERTAVPLSAFNRDNKHNS